MWIFLLAAMLAADEPSELNRARQDLEIVRQQAGAGLVPAAAVERAEEAVADAGDQVILTQTLYGRLRVEDLASQQAEQMVSAAERRVERSRRKLDEIRKLVDAGVAERDRASDLELELAAQTKALEQARARAALVLEIVAIAQEEAEQLIPFDRNNVGRKTKEHFEGEHPLGESDIRGITLAFEKQFRVPLPVSARGETAVHRALGFDHSGRVDIALAPDSPEGVWLRNYLESRDIPYYAFRAAVPGKATAPHIHIGPPSTRVHAAD